MNNNKPTLYLIRGPPGSGKSTFGEELAALIGIECFEADKFFYVGDEYKFDLSRLRIAHEWCKDQAYLELNDGFSCVVSNTSTTEKEVQTYKDIADKAGANFVSLIVENRHEGKSVHDVPDEIIAKMKNRFSVKL